MNDIVAKRESYKRINESFRKRYLHRFGRGVGFCAEFIHVLKAAATCLDRKIQFCLQENFRPQGFAVERGWTDHFEPLFPEVRAPLIAAGAHRTQFPLGRYPLFASLSRTWLKVASDCDYFVFDQIGSRPPAQLSVPELGLSDDYWANMQTLARILWSYNASTAQRVMTYRGAAQPHSDYNAIHVRRGDKEAEAGIHDLKFYVDAITQLSSDIRQIFIATDDVRIIDILRDGLGPDYDVRSSPTNNIGTGYNQTQFNLESISARREANLRFFAELEIMFAATHFIGASTSNVFNVVQYMRANRSITDIA
jgi:hypothetical protein